MLRVRSLEAQLTARLFLASLRRSCGKRRLPSTRANFYGVVLHRHPLLQAGCPSTSQASTTPLLSADAPSCSRAHLSRDPLQPRAACCSQVLCSQGLGTTRFNHSVPSLMRVGVGESHARTSPCTNRRLTWPGRCPLMHSPSRNPIARQISSPPAC